MVNYRSRLEVICAKWLLIIIMIGLSTSRSDAQLVKRFVRKYDVGLESNFGVRLLRITSNVSEINNLNLVEEGGSIGIVASLKPISIRLRHGYYYSSSSVASSIDLIRSGVALNFYPLQLAKETKSRVQPYVALGVHRNVFKMYGHYHPDVPPGNFSTSEAPFLGKIVSTAAGMGLGIEYVVKGPNHFVKIFTETTKGTVRGRTKTNEFFSQTQVRNRANVNIGVAFGYN
jgi:hypothetical protein